MIIDANNRRVVSMMPAPPAKVSTRNLSHLVANFARYDITELDDGTTIGLYWFNDRWTIRTKKGYAVDDLCYAAGHTYASILGDIMAKYPQFRLDRLDQRCCYTIGFKSSKVHPFLEGRPADAPITRAWFIQSVNLARVNSHNGRTAGAIHWGGEEADSIGLPIQATCRASSLAELQAAASSALEAYRARGVTPPNYGYILRQRAGGGADNSFILQSDLFNCLATIFYVNAPAGDITPESCILNAILDGIDLATLTMLLPQYGRYINTVEAVITDLASLVADTSAPTTRLDATSPQINAIVAQFTKIWHQRFGGCALANSDNVTDIAKMIHNTRYALVLRDVIAAVVIA